MTANSVLNSIVIGGGTAGAQCTLWMTKLGLKCGLLEQSKVRRLHNRARYTNSWLVAVQTTARVAKDLGYSLSEKVFFARNLMDMIRVFTQEKANMFRDDTQYA